MGEMWVFIVMDLMARGMDFVGVFIVINFDFFGFFMSYIYCIGCSGCVGCFGVVIMFFIEEDV